MCLMHQTAFVRSSQIRVLCGLDAYLAMLQARNPLGIYSLARTPSVITSKPASRDRLKTGHFGRSRDDG